MAGKVTVRSVTPGWIYELPDGNVTVQGWAPTRQRALRLGRRVRDRRDRETDDV